MAYDIFESFKRRLTESCDTRFNDVASAEPEATKRISSEQMFDAAFESVYGLSEDKNTQELTEALGEFPDWLKKFILNDRNGVKKALSKRGVDLAHAKYISGQLPKNAFDPAFKDPSRIAVFRMNASVDSGSNWEVIYIPGINDPDVYPDPTNRWSRYRASTISKKKLIELAKEYGYIDMNDSRNSNIELRNQRAKLKYGMVDRKPDAFYPKRYNVQYGTDEDGRTDYDNVVSFDVKWVTERGYDKSGYKLDPDKYGRMLDKVGLDDYSVRLEIFYNNIEEIRTKIIAAMNKYSVLDSKPADSSYWSRNVFENISRIVRDFSTVIEYYKELELSVKEIVAADDLTDEQKNRRIGNRFEWTGKTIRTSIKEINADLKSIES